MASEDAAEWTAAVVGKAIKSKTLEKYVGTVRTFFQKLGFGKEWSQATDRSTGITSSQGNPFASPEVESTLKEGVTYKVKVLREKPRK